MSTPIDKRDAFGSDLPFMANRSLNETTRLLSIVRKLRKECPWDRKQTHKSLIPYLIEEAYETADAIRSGKKGLKEELGDLLLQIVLHTQIASEKGDFNFEDVARAVSEKMIHRHPHVFSKAKYRDLATHLRQWTHLKQKEKPKQSLLEGIPKAMPSLQLAQRYGEITSSVGFDWNTPQQVLRKVKEELREFEQALKQKSKSSIHSELGDVLFTIANLARHLSVDSETVLKNAAYKFATRFEKIEKLAKRQRRKLSDFSADELEKLWKRVKNS